MKILIRDATGFRPKEVSESALLNMFENISDTVYEAGFTDAYLRETSVEISKDRILVWLHLEITLDREVEYTSYEGEEYSKCVPIGEGIAFKEFDDVESVKQVLNKFWDKYRLDRSYKRAFFFDKFKRS